MHRCTTFSHATPFDLRLNRYSVGPLDAWLHLAAEPANSATHVRFSACSSTLLHGAFSQGSDPSVAVYYQYDKVATGAAAQGRTALAVTHLAYTGTDTAKCGKPAEEGVGVGADEQKTDVADGAASTAHLAQTSDSSPAIMLDAWSFRVP